MTRNCEFSWVLILLIVCTLIAPDTYAGVQFASGWQKYTEAETGRHKTPVAERKNYIDKETGKPRLIDPVPVVTGHGKGVFQVGELLYWNDFENLNDWIFQIQETNAVVEPRIEVRDGFLDVLMPGRGATIWNRHKFSGPVAIVYNVVAPSTQSHLDGVIPRDINSFWHASDPDVPGNILNDNRYNGAFPSYHRQRGYYASTGGSSNRTTRFRHYPRMTGGEHAEHIALTDRDGLDEYLIHPDHTHTIQLVAYDDLIQYIVDGRVVYEIREGDTVTILNEDGGEEEAVYTRDRFPVYTEGWFGFRMVHTHHIFSRFRVYRLEAAD